MQTDIPRDYGDSEVTAAIGNIPLNSKKLQRVVLDEDLDVYAGLSGFSPYDQVVKNNRDGSSAIFRTSPKNDIRQSPFKDQNLRVIKIIVCFNEIRENSNLNEIMAEMLDTEQDFFISSHTEITRVFLKEVQMHRHQPGRYKGKFHGYDSQIVMLLIDTNSPDANQERFEYFKKALNEDKGVDSRYGEEIRRRHNEDVIKLLDTKAKTPGDTANKSNHGGNVSGKDNNPPPGNARTGRNRGCWPRCCKTFTNTLVGTTIGVTMAATAAGSAGAIVYLASPGAREWVDDSILNLMNAVIYGQVTDEHDNPVPDACLTFKGTRGQQDKTTTTGTEEHNKGNYESPRLYPDTYTITVISKQNDYATTICKIDAGEGRTRQDITIKKKTQE